jgi:hypothetical protein
MSRVSFNLRWFILFLVCVATLEETIQDESRIPLIIQAVLKTDGSVSRTDLQSLGKKKVALISGTYEVIRTFVGRNSPHLKNRALILTERIKESSASPSTGGLQVAGVRWSC